MQGPKQETESREDPKMTRNHETTVKALANEELVKVVGGTADPGQPIGDPGDNGSAGDDFAVQHMSMRNR
jgi:hypothetical protein